MDTVLLTELLHHCWKLLSLSSSFFYQQFRVHHDTILCTRFWIFYIFTHTCKSCWYDPFICIELHECKRRPVREKFRVDEYDTVLSSSWQCKIDTALHLLIFLRVASSDGVWLWLPINLSLSLSLHPEYPEPLTVGTFNLILRTRPKKPVVCKQNDQPEFREPLRYWLTHIKV